VFCVKVVVQGKIRSDHNPFQEIHYSPPLRCCVRAELGEWDPVDIALTALVPLLDAGADIIAATGNQ
jgi:hypothetical protein